VADGDPSARKSRDLIVQLPALNFIEKVMADSEMRLYSNTDKSGFTAVDFVGDQQWETKECIDYASSAKVMVVLTVYTIFVFAYAITGATAPPRALTASDTVPIRFPPFTSTNATIDIRLVDLEPGARWFDLQCSALRGTATGSRALINTTFVEIHRLKKGAVLSNLSTPRTNAIVFDFPPDSLTSDPVLLVPVDTRGHDTVILSLTMELGELKLLPDLRFVFSYPYINPCYHQYFVMMRYFFSGTVLYGLILYLMSWDDLLHQDQGCLLLGLLGLVACNPTNFWLQKFAVWTAVSDAIVMALFVNYFRFFVFERIRAVVNPKPSFVIGMYFVAFCIIDIWNGIGQDWPLTRAIAGRNRTLFHAPSFCHGAYAAGYFLLLIMQWINVCCREHELPNESNRTVCFGAVQIIALLAVVMQDCAAAVPSLGISAAPRLVFLAAHFGGAAACLIWLKEFQGPERDEAPEAQFVLDDSA
jgi:hypothetical protein